MMAHEHFCSGCYGRKTNGRASGWYRCVKPMCVVPMAALCYRHGSLPGEASGSANHHVLNDHSEQERAQD